MCAQRRSHRSRIRFGLAVLLGLIASSHAFAQPAEELKLEIELTGSCDPGTHVWVITNGRDNRERADWSHGCIWTRWIRRLDPGTSDFSLRIGDAERTPCRRARWANQSRDRIELKFDERDLSTGRRVAIAGPRVAYVRQVHAPDVRDGDIPCTEEGRVPGDVYALEPELEDLRLQLLEKKAVACGVIVDEFAPLVKAAPGDTVPMEPDVLARLVQSQGLMGRQCHPPVITVLEPIEQRLRRKNVAFRVKVH